MNQLPTIGFDRRVHLEWLDTLAWKHARGASTKELRDIGHRLLKAQCPSKVARGKTLTVIFHLWITVPRQALTLRNEAQDLLKDLSTDERRALHWGLAVASYPFFHAAADTAGRLLALQGNLSLVQLRRRLLERWGHRSTANRAAQRIVRTWIDWGILRETHKPGTYSCVAPIKVAGRLATWLIEALLVGGESESLPVSKLRNNPVLFPFQVNATLSDLRRTACLSVHRQGLDEDVISRRATPPKRNKGEIQLQSIKLV
jgi:hypothetical protein